MVEAKVATERTVLGLLALGWGYAALTMSFDAGFLARAAKDGLGFSDSALFATGIALAAATLACFLLLTRSYAAFCLMLVGATGAVALVVAGSWTSLFMLMLCVVSAVLFWIRQPPWFVRVRSRIG